MTHPTAPYIATLLCDPSFPALAERHTARTVETLEGAQAPVWLDKGIAADIPFTPQGPIDCRATAQALREAIADPQIDVIVQPAQGRRKKLLLVEMDKVLLRQTTSDEIAAVVGVASQRAEIAAKVAAGEIAHAEGTAAFFALLQGRTTDCLQQVLGKRMMMTPGARMLAETLRANQAHLAVATFGFSCFAGPVCQKAGITEAAANRLVLEGNRITALAEPVLDPAAKAAFIDQLLTTHKVSPADAAIVASSTADLPLFDKFGYSVAFRAEPSVAAAADAQIAQGDLTALLYAQGFAKEAFVTEARHELDASDWKRKYGAYEKAHERTRT